MVYLALCAFNKTLACTKLGMIWKFASAPITNTFRKHFKKTVSNQRTFPVCDFKGLYCEGKIQHKEEYQEEKPNSLNIK